MLLIFFNNFINPHPRAIRNLPEVQSIIKKGRKK
jgi:hypothetical protein